MPRRKMTTDLTKITPTSTRNVLGTDDEVQAATPRVRVDNQRAHAAPIGGDREIDGRMSAHFWYEKGTTIDELWADSQASEEEVAISRLWPRFEPGFTGLANGTYVGLATRWVSIDTKFSREPRTVLEFKGAESLETPVEVSLEGYVFPVSEADMMRKRLEAERQ